MALDLGRENARERARGVGRRIPVTDGTMIRALRKTTPSADTKFLFDFEKVLQENNASDQLETSYTSTDSQYGDLVSAYSSGTGSSDYYTYDALGDTDTLLDNTGSLADRWSYRAFGLATQTQGTDSNPFTFVGKQGYFQDLETELYFVRSRYYDPDAARWLSEDRIGYQGGDVNLYRYVDNNPVNDVDPSGQAILVNTECNKKDHILWLLRLQLFNAYGHTPSWQQPEQFTIPVASAGSTDYPNSGFFSTSYPWHKVELFDVLPADVWERIGRDDANFFASFLEVGGHIQSSFREDDFLTAPMGRLDWSREKPTGWDSFASFIWEVGAKSLQFLGPFWNDYLPTVLKLAQATFGKLLEAATGVKASDLNAVIGQLGEVLRDAASVLPDLVSRPREFHRQTPGRHPGGLQAIRRQ